MPSVCQFSKMLLTCIYKHLTSISYIVFSDICKPRMQFSLYIVLSIISATLQIKGIALCPNTCTCSDSSNGVAVGCNSKGLTSIPSEFPNDSYTM